MSIFHRYIGIDYSGAQTPESSLKGLRILVADGSNAPYEVNPPPSPRKYWTRRGLAEWLTTILQETPRSIVGIDHGFSFPLPYFERYGILQNWDIFLDDFCAHWPTDSPHTYVDFIRDGIRGKAAERIGDRRWRRITEKRTPRARSVFHFVVQGSVAKSTHAGIPWLRYLRRSLGQSVHFWPFDGWTPKNGRHVVAEVYPSLWRNRYPDDGKTRDQQDAYATSRWLQEMDLNDYLPRFFDPPLSPGEREVANIEGWILGVM
ncbi:MAG: hypothetical protein FJ139_00780 [Deltaproteobacteria bacterium]|nr:hypothetical protein [Deltaproteobacteria bacterium]